MPVPRSYSFCTCDVFTDRRFGGNQLAVVLEADELPADQMQAIAREFHSSETVFVLPPVDPAHTARARIFTPARELRFAGHPTIGTAFVLATCRPSLDGAGRIVLEEGVGPVSIDVERDGTQIRRCIFAAPSVPQQGPPAPARDVLAGVAGGPPRWAL